MPILSVFFGFVGLSFPTLAAWNGAGTVAGDPTATDINNLANWEGGNINGDFRTIVSNVDLVLTADHTATNGLDFGQTPTVLRHITISGTNTLTLSGSLPHYSFNTQSTHVMLSSNTANTVTFKKGLTISIASTLVVRGYGTLFIDAKVTGAGSFQNGTGSGGIFIFLSNEANDFTGNLGGDAGRNFFTSIGNSGVPSAAGSSGTLDPNNFPLVYMGSRSRSSNRSFRFNNGNSYLVNDSACGSLNMLGIVCPSTWYSATPMNFDVISSGELLVTNNLANNDATRFAKLRKHGSGTLRLTGHNTFTGFTNNAYHVELTGGTLVADYTNDVTGAGSNSVFLANRNFYYNDATLVVRGKTGEGNTTWQEFGTNTLQDYTCNVITADANGGDGTTVVLASLVMSGGCGLLRLEKKGPSVFRSKTPFTSDTDSVRLINGILMAASGTRSIILVKDDNEQVGFATQAADLEIIRNTNTLELTESNSSNNENVALKSDLARSANLNFATLDIDASANPVTLDLNGFLFQTSSTGIGRGVVVNGSYPVTIRNGTHGAQGSTFIYHYGTEKLSWELINSGAYVTAGPGLIEFTRPLAGDLYIAGSITRLTTNVTTFARLTRIYGNGVLEIGADLNGSAAGDFSPTIGSGSGQVMIQAGGGFSAYGANRTLTLASGNASITWPSDGKPFILSSPYSDATLILATSIDLGERAREFRVQNGSAAIDACLTNRIYGIRTSALIKSGDGTLELTGPQDYRGDVSVIAGGLRLGNNDVFAGGTNALVLHSAFLDAGTSRNTFNTLELLTDSVIEAGDGSATLAFSDCHEKTWTGTLTINGKLLATTLRFGTDSNGLTADQLAAITNRDRPVTLDAQGYLHQIPGGTILIFK